jgi:hypothetical protein
MTLRGRPSSSVYLGIVYNAPTAKATPLFAALDMLIPALAHCACELMRQCLDALVVEKLAERALPFVSANSQIIQSYYALVMPALIEY